MQEYHDTAYACSQIVTRKYSTSFYLAIRTLDKRLRAPICGIYGFVRLADEIVDTFHDFDKKTLLERFCDDTFRAIEEGISLNPVLHAFQQVVNQYAVDHQLIRDFIRSMEMDLETTVHGRGSFEEYVYGSAEAVGLMCLQVFCEGDQALYERLKQPARRLGAAFQKVNFLRDVQADYQERGRMYFPGVEWKYFTNLDKEKIEQEILEDFNAAYAGILALPRSSRTGVYLAYVYYLRLFEKIRKLPASRILHERVRVPDQQKLSLLVRTYLLGRLNIL